jgi:hypothetical protein
MGNRAPAGRLLVLDKSNAYGFGRLNQYHRDGSHVGMGKTRYQLFACDRSPKIVYKPSSSTKSPKRPRRTPPQIAVHWSRDIGVMVRAMVLTGAPENKTLFIAGPPNIVGAEAPRGKHPYTLRSPKTLQAQAAAFAGKHGGAIWAVSASTGKTLSKIALPSPPVWDGLAASAGRLYIATMDGKVSCYGKKASNQSTLKKSISQRGRPVRRREPPSEAG